MLDFHDRLESTRTELVNTINEKVDKIDKLESSVMELRTSREEIMLEGEIRAEELKAQLAKAVDESEELKKAHIAELEGLRAEVAEGKSSMKQHADLERRFKEVDQERQFTLRSLEESNKAAIDRDAEIAKYRLMVEQSSTELEKLRSEAYVRRNLEGDQAKLEAMLLAEREGRKMAEKDNLGLVHQLGELRELKASKKDWQVERRVLLDELEQAKATLTTRDTQITDITRALDDSKLGREAAEKAVKTSEGELASVKQELNGQSSEVYRLQMDLSTKTAESSNRINSLESQIMAEKARCQMLQDSKAAAEATLEEQSERLGAMTKDLDDFRSAVTASSDSTSRQAALIASLEEQVRIESGARKGSDDIRSVLEKEVVDLRAAVEGHETEVVRLCSESEGARRKLDQMKRDLEKEDKGRKAAEAKLGVAETAAIDRQTRIDNLTSDLEASRVKLEEQERHVVSISTQLDQANRDRSRAEEQLDSTSSGHSTLIAALRSEVDGLKTDLQTKDSALGNMSKAVEDAKVERTRSEGELATLKAERVLIETTLGEDYKALQGCLDTSAMEIKEARAGLEAAQLARDDLQTRYDSLSRDSAGTLQDATNQVALLQKKLDTASSHAFDLEKRLSTSEAGRLDA
jgi:chromosome segregation ATPase